jgi:hypothetical protein
LQFVKKNQQAKSPTFQNSCCSYLGTYIFLAIASEKKIFRKTVLKREKEEYNISTINMTTKPHTLMRIRMPEQLNAIEQGVTKRCRLSWLTNSVLVYETKCGGGRELLGLNQ